MIKLDVADYCQSCPKFEADVDGPSLLYGPGPDPEYFGDTIIRCFHREGCAYVQKFYEQKGEMKNV